MPKARVNDLQQWMAACAADEDASSAEILSCLRPRRDRWACKTRPA